MFDLGWSEILIIIVLTIIIVGPKDLPVVMKTIARYINKLRLFAGQFQANIDQMVRQSEFEELQKKIAIDNEAQPQNTIEDDYEEEDDSEAAQLSNKISNKTETKE